MVERSHCYVDLMGETIILDPNLHGLTTDQRKVLKLTFLVPVPRRRTFHLLQAIDIDPDMVIIRVIELFILYRV